MQEKLIPDNKPTLTLGTVALRALPPNGELYGPAPDRALVDSIERWGLLEPIILYGKDPSYRVHAGRRRIKAYRILSREWAERFKDVDHEEPNPYSYIHCFFADTEDAAAAFVTLTEQAVRRPNVAADIEAIEELIRQGLDDKQIAGAVGMSVGTVKSRIKLAQSLAPRLMEGLRAGLIKPSVAEAAAKLGRTAQGRLEAVYAEEGKLKMPHVEEERRRRVESASKQVSFDMPGMDELGIPEDAAPLTPPTESVGYLRDRLAEIRSKDQAKWTKRDMDALEALLTNL